MLQDEDDEDSYLLTNQSTNEISTLRTLISSWLHTGLVFRIMSVFIRSKTIILGSFYHRGLGEINGDCSHQQLPL